MPSFASNQQPFTGTATPANWTETDVTATVFTYSSVGVTITLPSATTSATDGDLTYGISNNLTGSFARLNVWGVSGVSATHTDNVLRVRQNSTNYITIFYEAGTLYFSQVVAGSQTNNASVAYSPTTHAWWQLREKGGTTYWETSPDGVNWTLQFSGANPITLTSCDVLIGAICFGIDTNPSPFSFKYFNYPLLGTTTSVSSTSISSTSSSISSTSSSMSSTSGSTSQSTTSNSTSSTSSSISSTSSSTSSTSTSSTSSSTSVSSTSSSISSTSFSSTSTSSTSLSTSISSTSSSFSSTSSSISSTSRSTSSTSFSSTSSSSSTSTTTTPPPYITDSYQDSLNLPSTGVSDLNLMNAYQESNVSGDDGDYFIQRGSKYMIQEYKIQNANNTDTPTFTWKGRSTYDTRISPFLIQIYNVNSSAWETLCKVNTFPPDVDFTMTKTQTTNISNYYDSTNTVTFRTYQQVL